MNLEKRILSKLASSRNLKHREPMIRSYVNRSNTNPSQPFHSLYIRIIFTSLIAMSIHSRPSTSPLLSTKFTLCSITFHRGTLPWIQPARRLYRFIPFHASNLGPTPRLRRVHSLSSLDESSSRGMRHQPLCFKTLSLSPFLPPPSLRGAFQRVHYATRVLVEARVLSG